MDESYDNAMSARLAAAARQSAGTAIGVLGNTLGQVPTETELSSLLSTISQQTYEMRNLAENILGRVSPMPEEDCAEKQCFGSGHIGTAEQIRSVQRETINTLLALAKLV